MALEIDKIYQGDCLLKMAEIDTGTVDAVITDPPYGIDYQSAHRVRRNKWKPKIANDKAPFVSWLDGAFRVLKNDSCLLCFCRWDVEDIFSDAIIDAGFDIRSQVIWDRVIHGMGSLKSSFGPRHDVIWFATKGNYVFPGERPVSIFRVPRVPPDKLKHPNEKPVLLMNKLITAVSSEGDIILDPFVGSGTLAVACKNTNRRFIGIELDAKYVDLANKRLLATPVGQHCFRQKNLFSGI